MRIGPFLMLGAASLVFAAPHSPVPVENTVIPKAILEAARTSATRPIAERMRAVSNPMLRKPYLEDPLGEGDGIDPDPPARYDAFDCLTLLEEVLALAFSPDPAHAAQVRQALRYGSQPPSYGARRHFMELQWLPENVADGWIVETTGTYGSTVLQSQPVTLETWQQWPKRHMYALSDDQLPVGTMRLNVLPLAAAQRVAQEFRPGSIVLTVRSERPGVPIWTTHVGFVVDGPKKLLRNASRRSAHRVVDDDLAWYLRHIETYDGWPVAGIAVFEPVDYGPRLARLPE